MKKADPKEWKIVTENKPSTNQEDDLKFAFTLVKHVKSNAILIAKDGVAIGVGAGQMSRVDAARIGASKAVLSLEDTVASSDAFFPFRDGLDVVAEAGATAVVQPGGSIRDDELIAAADEHDMAMVLTGTRHFRH